jgi:hypothetical protein
LDTFVVSQGAVDRNRAVVVDAGDVVVFLEID